MEDNRTRDDNKRRDPSVKMRRTAFALAAAALTVFAAVFFTSGNAPASISGDTESLMSDAAGIVEDGIAVDLKETFPISKDTKSLLSANTMVLQNPDFLSAADDKFTPADVGEDDRDRIIRTIKKEWPEDAPPWENVYAGYCENWVCDVYNAAGLPARGSCCASRSRDEMAVKSDPIPSGAMIYSGDGYSSGTVCEICGRDPGHVAIYLGDGMVAGSQTQYIMTLKEFREMFGYGGWSFSGNTYSSWP